jgi:hypothetical protein
MLFFVGLRFSGLGSDWRKGQGPEAVCLPVPEREGFNRRSSRFPETKGIARFQ